MSKKTSLKKILKGILHTEKEERQSQTLDCHQRINFMKGI
jgi:hypothetical protein